MFNAISAADLYVPLPEPIPFIGQSLRHNIIKLISRNNKAAQGGFPSVLTIAALSRSNFYGLSAGTQDITCVA